MINRFGWVVCMLIALALVPAWTRSARADEPERVTVEGSIEIAEEDDDGNVVSVYVRGGGDYLVLAEGRGASLKNHVGRWIEVSGMAIPRDEGDGFDYGIRVESFKFTDGLDDETAGSDEQPEEPSEPAEDEQPADPEQPGRP